MAGPTRRLLQRTLPEDFRNRTGRVYDDASAMLAGSPDERRRALRSWFFAGASRFTPVVGMNFEGRRYLLPTRDEVIGRLAFAQGRPLEYELLASVLGLLGPEALHDRDVLEIGANIGTTTVMLLSFASARTVIAAEPEPRNFALLQTNLAANGLTDRARCLPVAISDDEGECVLELSADNAGDHRVRAGGAALAASGRPVLSVPARTADALLADGLVEPERLGLVWIDVQGHEGHVLAGSHELLAHRVPVVTEVWPYALRRSQGLERLLDTAEEHFRTFVEMPAGSGERPIGELRGLVAAIPDVPSVYTDVLLLP